MPRTKAFDPDEALDRAMQLFWRQGYEATSVQELVDHMGINRFSLYDTFGCKHELFLAALDRYRDQVVTLGLRVLEGPRSGLEAIRRYFAGALDSVSARGGWRGCLMTNTAVEVAPHDRPTAARVRAHLERQERAFYRQLERAREAGELSSGDDLQDLARYLTGAAQGLGVLAKARRGRRELENYVAVVLSVLG